MVILTGDTHRDFSRVFNFCTEYGTTADDVLVILGDACINYFRDESDRNLKKELCALPITLLCIHGNHEERPFEIDGYEERPWRGGLVYMEPEFSNLLFAKDGEIYDLEGKKAIAIGGAYSVDKYFRLDSNLPWFPTEQPSEPIKAYVEARLERADWKVDYVFSHTAPRQYEPTWAFLPRFNQELVDKSTEDWLDSIEKRLDYTAWYCGHYHVESQEGPVRVMFEDFTEI